MSETKPESTVVRKYYGLSWPTLIVGAVVLLIIAYGVYGIYITAMKDAVGD